MQIMKQITPERTLLISLLLTFGFDQLTKDGAHIFGFVTHYNTGVSLNALAQFPSELLTGGTLLILVALWYAFAPLWKEKPVLSGLFFGAGLSNILDRAWYGAVRDWLPVPGTAITNNLADWLIFGVLFFFGLSVLKEKNVS